MPRAPAVLAALLLVACDGSRAPVQPAAPFVDRGFAEAGEQRLHYALTPTRDLPPGVAGSYGIVQRRDLALLTVTLASREPSDGTRVHAFALEATAISLTGARRPLALARHDERGGPTWLATVEVLHRVPVTIEIRARATATSPEIRARLTREFRLD